MHFTAAHQALRRCTDPFEIRNMSTLALSLPLVSDEAFRLPSAAMGAQGARSNAAVAAVFGAWFPRVEAPRWARTAPRPVWPTEVRVSLARRSTRIADAVESTYH